MQLHTHPTHHRHRIITAFHLPMIHASPVPGQPKARSPTTVSLDAPSPAPTLPPHLHRPASCPQSPFIRLSSSALHPYRVNPRALLIFSPSSLPNACPFLSPPIRPPPPWTTPPYPSLLYQIPHHRSRA
ncbi:hypothetical protein EW146_g1778 [Bondarzewia mesenterica]|uniref:Uncharacterized protein n=1 Tax=Bondarzewia mesenterica TaxID=1095465 RepID=A0A4V3XFZ2_9AGAM|nr:hypothetical protein EW146_g1778 [Bondarzewia mesenterica]